MKQTEIVENGNKTEGINEVNYSVGITKDKAEALFTNGSNGTTYYCAK
jgi:hypothetical protein